MATPPFNKVLATNGVVKQQVQGALQQSLDGKVRVKSVCDLGYDSWSQTTTVPDGKNCVILVSIVLIHYRRVMACDG